MKTRNWFLNTALAVAVFVTLAVFLVLRTFLPRVILPQADIPNMVLLCLAVLVLDFYLAPGAKRCYICVAVTGLVCFGLLPLCAGYALGIQALWMGLRGMAVYTVTVWLYDAILDRISTGPKSPLAPVLCALCLFLASQGMMGM